MMSENDTPIEVTEAREDGRIKSASVWSLEETEMRINTTFNQTRTALTEGVVVSESVGIRLAEDYEDTVEVLEFIDGQWQVVLTHPFEIEKNYILTRKEHAWGIPNEIEFSSRITRGASHKNNLRFYVGNGDQTVMPAWRLEITFPPPQSA